MYSFSKFSLKNEFNIIYNISKKNEKPLTVFIK